MERLALAAANPLTSWVPETFTVPRSVDPSKNETVPVGETPELEVSTKAVNVVGVPAAVEVGAPVIPVTVAAFVIVNKNGLAVELAP